MTNKDFRTYFNDLASRYPMLKDIPVTLRLQAVVKFEGRTPRGLATLENRKITLQVATKDQHPLLVIKTIAHEYRHAIQWINMDWRTDKFSDPAMELDANKFGQAEVRMVMSGGICGSC